jgi:hypothetical protein
VIRSFGHLPRTFVSCCAFAVMKAWQECHDVISLGISGPRVSGGDVFQNCLHLFGSDLYREPGTANETSFIKIDSLPDDPLFEDEYDWCVRPQVQALSTGETFQMLADAIVRGDAGIYNPTRKPNTHWQNWPDGGNVVMRKGDRWIEI